MATVDRALGVLQLFASARSEWTVEAAARELGLSQATAYQYFRSLVESGLLSSYTTGRYVIGPAIIELDRQTRRRDPLILAAREQMDELGGRLNNDDIVLLCRLYKYTVMCVDQRAPVSPHEPISYERGRPMPMDRGAASKSILANLAPRALRRYYSQAYPDGTPEWKDFSRPLRAIRKAGLAITRGELDPGRIGISAPVFGESGVIGSIGLVLSEETTSSGEVDRALASKVMEAAKQISATIRSNNPANQD